MISDDWTTRYAQIHHPTLRSRARHVSLSALARLNQLSGFTERALARPRVHFVYLHHVFQDEVQPFRQLVKTLCKRMQPITYSDGVERILTDRIDRPYVTFSFDDGFKNCLTAASTLEEFGALACFFVCPSVVGESDRTKVQAFARDRLHLPAVEFMDWGDLESLLQRGHEIGNHTKSHDRLSEAHALDEEIRGSLQTLTSRLGNVQHFAWPYGSFNAISKNAVNLGFASGHRSIASGQRGAHVVGASAPERLCLRREHVIAAWPASHVLYLLAASAARAKQTDNDWPTDLR